MKKVLLITAIAVTVIAAAAYAKQRSGQEVFKQVCMACHASGMMDAPIAQSAEFTDRLKEKGLDKLVENAMNGFNEMPKKGSCGDCTKSEIEAAIKYMVGK